jgi:hypothetical protein
MAYTGAVYQRPTCRAEILKDPFIVAEHEPGVLARHAQIAEPDITGVMTADPRL